MAQNISENCLDTWDTASVSVRSGFTYVGNWLKNLTNGLKYVGNDVYIWEIVSKYLRNPLN